MEFRHSSLSDFKAELTNSLADKANNTDVYAITGERSQLARSILRLPQLQRSVLDQQLSKLERMKMRSEERLKKIANSFMCTQTSKAVNWQHADVHWAASTATKMPCYRNNSFRRTEPGQEHDFEIIRSRRPDSNNVILYRSADYSNFGDKTYYRLMRGNADMTKPPPVAGLSSGPRLEFLRVGGHTCFNKVTHTTTKDVVDSYNEMLKNRNRLLSRATARSLTQI